MVFREGDFTPNFFYPVADCIPPKGFSVMTVEGDFQSASCESSFLSTPTLLTISEPTARRQEVVCEATDVWRFKPPKEPLNDKYQLSCISHTELAVVDPIQPCKQLSILSLVDCGPTSPDCSYPEWDIRDEPPSWWPCAEE